MARWSGTRTKLCDRLLDAAIAGLRVVCRAAKHRDPVTYFLAGEAQNRLKGWRR